MLAAHWGFSEKRAALAFKSDLTEARRIARWMRACAIVGSILFVVSSMAFVGSMFVVAQGLWQMS